MDPRRWLKDTDYPDLEFRKSLRAYSKQRADLIARLEGLAPKDWVRTAIVMAWGLPLEQDVLHFADRLARHERTHVKQVESIVDGFQ
jgi:hypothetical protein